MHVVANEYIPKELRTCTIKFHKFILKTKSYEVTGNHNHKVYVFARKYFTQVYMFLKFKWLHAYIRDMVMV